MHQGKQRYPRQYIAIYLPVNVMLVGLSLKYPTAKKNLIVENALGPKELWKLLKLGTLLAYDSSHICTYTCHIELCIIIHAQKSAHSYLDSLSQCRHQQLLLYKAKICGPRCAFSCRCTSIGEKFCKIRCHAVWMVWSKIHYTLKR